jgi:hypothetical protein
VPFCQKALTIVRAKSGVLMLRNNSPWRMTCLAKKQIVVYCIRKSLFGNPHDFFQPCVKKISLTLNTGYR